MKKLILFLAVVGMLDVTSWVLYPVLQDFLIGLQIPISPTIHMKFGDWSILYSLLCLLFLIGLGLIRRIDAYNDSAIVYKLETPMRKDGNGGINQD